MSGFRQILRHFGAKDQSFDTPLAPDGAFVAVGDIHGRADLLRALLDQVDDAAPGLPLVFLGDYIDRGPDSSGVLRTLRQLEVDRPGKVACLSGNHEAMLLDALDAPASNMRIWLRNGGDATLDSFGLPADIPDDALPDALHDALGHDLIDWLRNRPLLWQSGNVVASHAGGDPTRPIEARRGHGLLWGHRKFLTTPRSDGLWVVHGHYIHATPDMRAGRIALDTGAYRTGRLSAARIAPGKVDFFTTTPAG